VFSRLWLSDSIGPDSFLKITSGVASPGIIFNRLPPCTMPHCHFLQGVNMERILMICDRELGEELVVALLAETIIPND
jgi:hypothetical protein